MHECISLSCYANLWNYVGNTGGGQLKEVGTAHWRSPNTGANNLTGFTAPGGGLRTKDGLFVQMGEYALFWTAREEQNIAVAYTFRLSYLGGVIYTNGYYKSGGLSVRCVKD